MIEGRRVHRDTDFVIATGETHSVKEFCEAAFSAADLAWENHVETDSSLLRPAEVDLLVGDASKAREKLQWQPSITFSELVRLMVDADIQALSATL